MAQPVWVLSVDLQTRTATFQSGMADAAKAARGSFQDIKEGAQDMTRATGGSMSEARHGVMLLGEEFGIHLPRGVTTFIASLGPVGAAMEAAFPFLAIVVGATVLLEHLTKLKEAGDKLTDSQINFGTTTANVLNALDEKLLQAGIRADELSGNHLAALEKQLQLIDHQSLKELEQSFSQLDKSADAVMAQLKAHWYEFGTNSEGAKHALEEFKQKYDLLLAQGKDKEASDLLAGTLKSAERIRDLQSQMIDNQSHTGAGKLSGDYQKFAEAHKALKDAGTGIDDKEIQAQVTLVDALRAQVEAEKKINDLKAADKSNATQKTNNTLDAESDKQDRLNLQELKKQQEEEDRLYEEHYKEVISQVQEGEAEKIEATRQGSTERIAVITAAIKEENGMGLQETGFFKSLLKSRVQAIREEADEEKKIQADLGKELADHESKMGEIQLAADEANARLKLSTHRATDQEIIANETQFANQKFALQKKQIDQEIQALDKGGKDYEVKLKTLQDKETELTQAHENQISAIMEKAEEQRNSRILSARTRFDNTLSSGLTQSIMGHESWAKMMTNLGDQVVSGLMENAIKSVLADDFTKERDAAAAARKMFLAGASLPFPANIVAAPALAAGAFAAVMAFHTGGIVPGESNTEVPAMLLPGESVLPKDLTDGLRNAAATGDLAGNNRPTHIHQHSHEFHIHAMDGASVRDVLTKHGGEFQKHFENTLRRMNR